GLEQLLRGQKSRAVGVLALFDPLRMNGQSRGPERRDETFIALGAVDLPRVAENKADVPMAERQQVARHFLGRLEIIDAQREPRPVLTTCPHRHEWNAGRIELP